MMPNTRVRTRSSVQFWMSESGLTRCPSGVGLKRICPVLSYAIPKGLS